VKAAIAAERILEYKIQDGWDPLCKFLNKQIPSEAFPRRITTILTVGISFYRHRRSFF